MVVYRSRRGPAGYPTAAEREPAFLTPEARAAHAIFEAAKDAIDAAHEMRRSVRYLVKELAEAEDDFLRRYRCAMLAKHDPGLEALRIEAQHGFDARFLESFDGVRDGHTACGAAYESAQLLDAGVRAVQSTPLIGQSGRVLGIVSTHWRLPGQPAARDLRLVRVLARAAARPAVVRHR